MSTPQTAVIEQIAADVAYRYGASKRKSPDRKVDYSSLLLEEVRKRGFTTPSEIAEVRSRVAKAMAARRRARANRGRT